MSADGTRVAFTSDAYNLSPAKCNPARGIFVRDLRTSTTTLVSSGDGLNRGIGPTKGSGGESAMRIALLCAGQTPSSAELVERALKLGGVAVDAEGAGGLELVGAVAA